MSYRKLRIAFSAVCGIFCLLFAVLWVRSHTWGDTLMGPISQSRLLCFSSVQGRLLVRWDYGADTQRMIGTTPDWYLQHISVVEMEKVNAQIKQMGGQAPPANYKWGLTGDGAMRIPIWLSALFSAAIAGAPWLPWRFSLRTLLIATTLIATVLGLVVYATGE